MLGSDEPKDAEGQMDAAAMQLGVFASTPENLDNHDNPSVK